MIKKALNCDPKVELEAHKLNKRLQDTTIALQVWNKKGTNTALQLWNKNHIKFLQGKLDLLNSGKKEDLQRKRMVEKDLLELRAHLEKV